MARGLHKINTVDIRHEPEGHGAIGIVSKRFVGHYRPQIRTTYADINNIANPLPGVALPDTVSDPVREVGHAVENLVDLRNYVLAINQDGSFLRRAQSHMEHGSLLRNVD